MEERTNNAIEKVENIINAKKHPKSMRVKNREDTAEERKAKQERYMAEKRVELARLRAHKKAEKQKAKAMAERERNRRKAEIKQRKQEENQARERRKAERRNERAQARQRGKDRNKGFGGWLAAVITLSVATLVLASVLTFTFLMPTASDGMLESTYQKSFYDTVKQVNNIDVNLSKILATSDTGAIQKYLVETAINSEIAETDLQQLPLHDESRYYTTKLINQIGDYAKYLNNKLVDGEKLNKEDEQRLKGLYQANRTLKNALAEMTNGMGNDFSFRTVLDGGDGNLIINGFNELENMSVDYPELIYDGPFSDGQDEREIKGVNGEEITSEQAVEEYKKIFKNYGLEKVMANGMTSSEIECYNVQGEKDGETLYAEISKKGGRLIMFTSAGSCRATNVTEESAEQTAKEFLKGIILFCVVSVNVCVLEVGSGDCAECDQGVTTGHFSALVDACCFNLTNGENVDSLSS